MASLAAVDSGPPQRWGVPATLAWSLAVAALCLVLQVVTVVVYFAVLFAQNPSTDVHAFARTAPSSGEVIAVTLSVASLACVAALFGIVKLKKGSRVADHLAMRRVSIRATVPWVLLAVALVIVFQALMMTIGRNTMPESMVTAYVTASPVWPLWVAVVVLAPFLEEVYFRGFLFTGLEASRIGPIGAILATAILWALVHPQYDLEGRVFIFALGCILGAARFKTGSIVPTLTIHGLNNMAAMTSIALYVQA